MNPALKLALQVALYTVAVLALITILATPIVVWATWPGVHDPNWRTNGAVIIVIEAVIVGVAAMAAADDL